MDEKILFSLARFGREINIQAVHSREKGKGYGKKYTELLKKDCEKRGFELVSSTPVNPAWRHICEKLKIKIYEL